MGIFHPGGKYIKNSNNPRENFTIRPFQRSKYLTIFQSQVEIKFGNRSKSKDPLPSNLLPIFSTEKFLLTDN
jgi:hypothetical protein